MSERVSSGVALGVLLAVLILVVGLALACGAALVLPSAWDGETAAAALVWVWRAPRVAAAAVVGALCFWIGHLIGDVTGSIVIFAILVAASGYMYWRAQQNKVDHSNVTADWDSESNSVLPADEGPTSRPASV